MYNDFHSWERISGDYNDYPPRLRTDLKVTSGVIFLLDQQICIFRSLQIQNFKTKFNILLSTCIDLNSADSNGETALHRACQYGNSMMISMLLRAGAARNFCKLSRCFLSDEGTFLPPAFRRNGEGNIFTRVCLSVHRGYLPWLGDYLPWLRGGGTYLGWGIPIMARGYLPWTGVPTLAGGTYPGRGGDTYIGQRGYLGWGVPTLDGGYPPGKAQRVLATRRAVCLLCSRSRTFLLCFKFIDF